MTKRCSKCKQEKDIGEFGKCGRHKDGLTGDCKECRRTANHDYHLRNREKHLQQNRVWYQNNKARSRTQGKQWYETHKEQAVRYSRERHLQKNFGLSISQHMWMYVKQNGCCKVCGREVPYDQIATDHNHATGAVRGLLCHRCNLALGQVREDPAVLDQLKEYLRKTANE